MRDLTIFHVVHNIGRSLALAKFMGHKPHRPIDVPEELLITRTQIIKTRFTVRRFDKTVLGAFAVADETDLTLAAVSG